MAQLEPHLVGLTQEERNAYRSELLAANTQAIERLRGLGRRLGLRTSYGATMDIVQEVTGRAKRSRSALEYLQAFLSGDLDRGKPAPGRTVPPFRPLSLPIALQRNFTRASQAQPKLYTPNGYGEYSRSWGGSEGKQ